MVTSWPRVTSLPTYFFSLLLTFLIGCSAETSSPGEPAVGPYDYPNTEMVPAGIYILTPPGKPVLAAALNSEKVAGIVLRGNWQDLDQPGKPLKLEYYIEQLDRIQAAGKSASLVINSGGVNTPQYVLDDAKHTVSFVDGNRFHATSGQRINIPSFWDANFLQHKREFIRRLGEALTDHPALKLVSVQCANATTDDWNIPPGIDWGTSGFDADAMIAACAQMNSVTARSFPKQAMRMAIGSMAREMKDYRSLPGTIARNALANYPGRYYIQRHNLAVNTPVPGQPRGLMGWRAVAEAKPFIAAQFLWPASDTVTCRLNNGLQPCSAESMFSSVAEIIEAYGFRYVEVYGVDFEKLSSTQAYTDLYRAVAKDQTWVGATAPGSREPQQSDGGGARADQPRPPRDRVGQFPSPQEGRDRSGERRVGPGGGSGERPRHAPTQAGSTKPIYGNWSNPPGTAASGDTRVRHFEMSSKLLSETVGFTLYMPIQPEPGEVLPVIYWLHGKGGNETRGAYISGYLDEAIARNAIRPTAMVLVNGGLQSFYSDTYDGEVPVESMIMQELIPFVEKQFPVGRHRHKRLIEGYSMGGFGALKLASKYPDKFASVAIFGAALLSEEFLPKRNDQEAYERVFDANPEYFIKNTPSYWLEKNAEQIRTLGLPIRMRIGTSDGTRRYNFAVAEDIKELGLLLDFDTYEGVRHAPRQYYDVDSYGSFAFHEANMASGE